MQTSANGDLEILVPKYAVRAGFNMIGYRGAYMSLPFIILEGRAGLLGGRPEEGQEERKKG